MTVMLGMAWWPALLQTCSPFGRIRLAAPAHTALHRGDDLRPQLLRPDDRIHGTHPLSTLDRMHAVELGGNLAQLLRTHLRPDICQPGDKGGPLVADGFRDAPLQLHDSGIARGTRVDVRGEHDRRRRSAAEHRGVRAVD